MDKLKQLQYLQLVNKVTNGKQAESRASNKGHSRSARPCCCAAMRFQEKLIVTKGVQLGCGVWDGGFVRRPGPETPCITLLTAVPPQSWSSTCTSRTRL